MTIPYSAVILLACTCVGRLEDEPDEDGLDISLILMERNRFLRAKMWPFKSIIAFDLTGRDDAMGQPKTSVRNSVFGMKDN